MSVQTAKFLHCNGRTSCISFSSGIGKTSRILRRKSKSLGWHSIGDYDLCPTCYKTFFGVNHGLSKN